MYERVQGLPLTFARHQLGGGAGEHTTSALRSLPEPAIPVPPEKQTAADDDKSDFGCKAGVAAFIRRIVRPALAAAHDSLADAKRPN